MPLNTNLKIEALSSILNEVVKPYGREPSEERTSLSVTDFHLLNLIGGRPSYVKEFYVQEEEFFDHDYDWDFTVSSDTAECLRGGERYERPQGWYRIALKVKGKYRDDVWLGTTGWRNDSVPGEWPVSYHGTSLDGSKGIIRSYYKAGPRDLYGRGIYSTPDIHVAEQEGFAKTFKSKTMGKSYKVILQNRINTEKREICQRSDYWLVRVDESLSRDEEKEIVESSIRPYGILIQEI